MAALDDRRYGISEVSEIVGVPVHVLRQWEERFAPLRPKRDRANRRVYTDRDVAVARRIKELVRGEKMTTEGAAKVLAKELRGEGRPKTRHEALELLDRMEAKIRGMLDVLDQYDDEHTR